eukprot:gene44032-59644_t
MICAPISLRCAGVSDFTVPCVPTGMKIGVSIMPCRVRSRARRAAVAVSVFRSWKCSGIGYPTDLLTVLLVIDNYDSFTFNLVQYFGQLGVNQRVFRNNEITPAEALALNPERVLLSPGPCSPREAGVTLDIIKAFEGKKPILGVCLGHQSIGHYYGGNVIRASRLMH